MSDHPISDHALLSDCRSAALVDSRGSVEWWCVPRFDGPSVFGRLLDPDGGHFALSPVEVREVSRRYLPGTLAVETTFATSSGVVVLVDVLALAEGVSGHQLGEGSPGVLLRRLRCTQGSVEVEVSFAPRPEYGLTTPLLRAEEGTIVARGGPVSVTLSTPTPLTIDGATASGTLALSDGEQADLAAEVGSSWEPAPDPWTPEAVAARIDDTVRAWRSWEAEHQRYDGPYSEEVTLAGRVLQGLTYQPTGAIVAAPTTSLPEVVGGSRNWDYRYAWVRDASLTLDALWVAACPDEATTFLSYLTTAASSIHVRGRLQIMFGIDGERYLPERELGWLRGWRDSRPVRVGNGAWDQTQTDVYGELLAAVHRLRSQLGEVDDAGQGFLATLADAAAEVWTEPDNGIWEIRGEPRHYVHSKVMCWVALDRAVRLADLIQPAPGRLERWEETRDAIAAAVVEQGWSEERGSFTQAFDTDQLDASLLLLGNSGFLPADDPRVVATVDAVEADLTDERGLVWRYRASDGLEGEEGTFLLCTFWLAEAHARAGRPERARTVMDRALAHANDLGLLSEEVAADGSLIGNFPQAFSHIGVVNAAWAIAQAESSGGPVLGSACGVGEE